MRIPSKIKTQFKNTQDNNEVREHMIQTYHILRRGMVYVSISYPFILLIVALFAGISFQPSISDFYFALPPIPAKPDSLYYSFPVRAYFVGGLCAVGFALYLYKGFSPLENTLLNIAGVCAAGIALFPMKKDGFVSGPGFEIFGHFVGLHYIFAVAMFFFLGLVSVLCARNTLKYLPDNKRQDYYMRWYKLFGILMFTFPIIGIILNYMIFFDTTNYVFFIELAGILIFAGFWWIKSREMLESSAEKILLK